MSNYTPYEIYNWITDAPLKAGPKTVLLVLARYLNQKRNEARVWPSQATIADKALMNRDTVRTHLRTLEKLGYIAMQRIKIPKGERCEYVIIIGGHAEKTCTPMPKKPAPHAEKPCIKETHKKGLYPEKKVEGTSYHATSPPGPSVSESWEKTQGETGAEVAQLTRDYFPQWTSSRPARLAVYCKLGRKHFPGNRYFTAKKFAPHHLDTLDLLFDQWGKWSADVCDFVFENWDDYREKRRVTPTLMALDNIEDWQSILSDYMKARQQREYKAMIARVESSYLGDAEEPLWDFVA